MRQKRAKSYRKQMHIYHLTFKFREPYQVLFDDLIIQETSSSNYNLLRNTEKLIQGTIKPMITQCCMNKLYSAGDQDLISWVKLKFERRRCNHDLKNPKTPKECLEDIVNVKGKNKHRYVVVTQDNKLRSALRKVPGVPLIYINRSVMIMEPLSKGSEKIRKQEEDEKLVAGLNDVNFGKRKHDDAEDEEEGKKKKKKGPKGPNPLSIKKSKKETIEDGKKENVEDGTNDPKKKPRKRRTHKKHEQEQKTVDEKTLDDKSLDEKVIDVKTKDDKSTDDKIVNVKESDE